MKQLRHLLLLVSQSFDDSFAVSLPANKHHSEKGSSIRAWKLICRLTVTALLFVVLVLGELLITVLGYGTY